MQGPLEWRAEQFRDKQKIGRQGRTRDAPVQVNPERFSPVSGRSLTRRGDIDKLALEQRGC